MRCFIAVDLEPTLAKKIESLQEELKDFDVKLVELHNLHFTMKFLDDIDKEVIKNVRDALDKLASSYKPFAIDIQNIGVFPNENFIRVVWIGADGLTDLQVDVNEALAKHFKKEKPSPHLTIARIRSQSYRKEIVDFVHKHKGIKIGNMQIGRIILKKSTVTSKGPIYEDVATFRLGA